LSSWAPAARNLTKLQKEVLERLSAVEPGPDGLKPMPPIEADCDDHESLVRMCARAKCVLTCAGPYYNYGEGVVRACIEAGTHYADITGEVEWVESMMRKYGEEAEAKGVLLVSCAGYDSVPPDLATFLAAKALEADGEALQRFETFVYGNGGAMPTGTIETGCVALASLKRRALSAATFGLLGSEEGEAASGDSAATFVPEAERESFRRNLLRTMLPGYSPLARGLCLPHFMAPINLRTVHRTAALEGYGGIVYRERAGPTPSTGTLFGAVPTVVGAGVLLTLAAVAAIPYACKIIRSVRDSVNPPLQKKVRDSAFNGFASTGTITLQGLGISKTGRRSVKVDFHCEQDGGLGFTMLSACTVATELSRKEAASTDSKHKGGFHTAVCALGGAALADALRNAGVSIQVSVA